MYRVTPPVALSPGELFVIPEKKERKKHPDSWFYLFVDVIPAQLLPGLHKSPLFTICPKATHIPSYNISNYLREEVLPDKDEGKDV